MCKLASLLIVALLPGCITNASTSRQESLKARMLATSRAESEEKKALEAVDNEAKREEIQAVSVEISNPRAGCNLRAENKHKTCRDRAALYAKSFRSAFQALADPKACDDTYEIDKKTCAQLPETR